MKNFISLVLVLILAWSAAGQTFRGISLVGPFTKSAFSCLIQQGYSRFTIRMYKVSGTPGIDPHGVQTLQNALAAISTYSTRIYNVYLYIQLCRGQDPLAQINAVKTATAHLSFANIVWLKVEPNSTPGCTWEGYNPVDSCYFVSQAINAVIFWAGAGHVGVFSTPRIWEKFFGVSCTPGTQFGYPYIWYANYNHTGNVNSTASFADFTSFGGWTVNGVTPYMKQVGGNVTINLCSITWYHAFVDQTWSYW